MLCHFAGTTGQMSPNPSFEAKHVPSLPVLFSSRHASAHARSRCLGIACTEGGQVPDRHGKGGEEVEFRRSAGIAKWNLAT